MRTLAALGVGVVLLCGGGCGGTSESPTRPPAPSPAPTPTPRPSWVVLAQWSVTPIPYPFIKNAGMVIDFVVPTGPGRVVATVRWAHPESRIRLWIAQGHCRWDQAPCTWVASSADGPSPREMSIPAVAGDHTLVIQNDGPLETEDGSYEVIYYPDL
jgi:hypothetical protein